MQAQLEAEAAQVQHVNVAAPIVEEQRETHAAIANLDLGVEHQMERNPAAPPIDFGENPLIVDQQSATRLDALHAIQ